jgi:hypothetical protein
VVLNESNDLRIIFTYFRTQFNANKTPGLKASESSETEYIWKRDRWIEEENVRAVGLSETMNLVLGRASLTV